MAVALALASGGANAGSGASSNEPPILFAGGINKKTLASAELFEPNEGPSGSFAVTGPMRTAREGHTATVLQNGKVLVAGGASKMYGAGRKIFASAELYNPSKRRFSGTGGMLEARTGHTATLLADGKVLIVGGNDGTTSLTSAELYDPASAKFTETGAISIGRERCTATLLSNGQVLVAGGITLQPDGNGSDQDSAELYDPALGSFTPTGTMTAARDGHTATLLPDGRVLITGGIGNDGVLDTAELYDPMTGLFSAAGQMTTSRYGHLAATLGDGDVLVAGGIDNAGSSLKSAEVFVVSSGKFVKVAAMPRDRFMVGATVLSSSKVLVAGGYKQCPSSAATFCEKPVNTALIFDHKSNTFHTISPMTSPRGTFASATLSRVAH